MDRSYTQKVNEEILVLNDKLEQVDNKFLKNTPSECSKINILLNTHGIVSRIHHILGQKTSLNTFRKVNIKHLFQLHCYETGNQL